MAERKGTEALKCPICGETDPMPASFCLRRISGNAIVGEPCSYSREGNDRLIAEMNARMEAEWPAPRGPEQQGGGRV